MQCTLGTLKTRAGGCWKSRSWPRPDGTAGGQQTQANRPFNVSPS